MASRTLFQAPPTLAAPKASDRPAVPTYHPVDPLLGNLSPESTLQALLSSIDAVPNDEQAAQDILAKSISQASAAERALGIRAALAAQKLGDWYKEVHSWPWPKRPHTGLGKGFIPPADDTGYWGSLPSTVVEEHEKRIQEIRDGMDGLEVEELKEHVLNAHIPGRSRPSSANSTMSVPPPLSYVQLSDFTAVITATILRALPLLSRLNSLLSTWHARLVVCRQIPGLLRDLRFVKSEVKSAFDLVKSSTPPTEKDDLYSVTNYHAKRTSLESTVVSAGRRMDRILDSLEGREDSLPENWIDDLEAVEADFASWVMQAERRAIENEWRRLSTRPMETIVEEISSPIDHAPLAQRAGNIMKMVPASPTPLPADRLPTFEAREVQVMKLESASETVGESTVLDDTASVDAAPEAMAENPGFSAAEPRVAAHETIVEDAMTAGTYEADVVSDAPLETVVKNSVCDTTASSEAPKAVVKNGVKLTAPTRCVTPPTDNVASLPNLFLRHDDSKATTERPQPEESGQDEKNAKKPLDSPIKLSEKQKSRIRRPSHTSDGSLSDFPSLVSSPEMPEPRNSSSNGTPLLLETPPSRPTKSSCHNHDHGLREDRLLHLDAQKPSPRDAFGHGRTLSLPLQRFIDERHEVNYGHSSSHEDASGVKKAPTPTERRQKSKSASTRAEPLSNITTARLRKQLTTHPSLESIGSYKSKTQPPNTQTLPKKPRSRASSINKQPIRPRPKDQMDEKISSILTSLPGNIHLVSADQDDDAISVASSVPFRRERLRSDSPQGTPSRSFTPTSLTLRPALGRRRHSHAPEESSVKLYHLHRGGKSAPTKLFVRTVGDGERVMVRVGGGWADLAEYLREYAIHHGHRRVSETPRVEVEGLSPRVSPSHSPPSSTRPMPARPHSVLSNRPSSSLAVRKTRRSSNVSDFGDRRTVNGSDSLNVSFSAFSNRRLSVSSNVSAGAMSSVSELRHGSPGAPAMPLGLAGPKPRAAHATISPESEAWVEDVLGQARRSTSLRPFKYTLPSPENADGHTPAIPKSRSISDIGKAGSSKRVVLRGLR
ncbi:GAS2 domain protein [Aspergillus mulundensis]|uniref:GAR domain-containing protein n=1 Tax=Aspergillus mulundensis TaxID=1810919 RepID=A0A3D8SBY2_9EURO|nr:hypothetical protein DSM5745_04183 [Aspergillus mulundensis]RDW83857.1 hypothetical protein DSM5745_04183 [Aspergillus mulundensis]